MHIQDIFRAQPTTFSFEFFPPKTNKASDELFGTIAQLQTLRPSFVSVTYGAGGSTRERTHDLIVRIQRETQLTAVSHLTCVCHTKEELGAILDRYAESRIENILALGGDPPQTMANHDRARDAFQYAEHLVQFIRSNECVPDPRGFGIGVAGFPEGHPTTPNRLKELEYLKRKVDAGADYICTSSSSSNADYDSGAVTSPIACRSSPISRSRENLNRWPSRARFGSPRAIGRDDDRQPSGSGFTATECRDLLTTRSGNSFLRSTARCDPLNLRTSGSAGHACATASWWGASRDLPPWRPGAD
jgi:methylenetetrahydrofolate reductase (NADPH)